MEPVPRVHAEPLERTPTARQRILLLEEALREVSTDYGVRVQLAREYTTLAAFEADLPSQRSFGHAGRAHALAARRERPDALEGRYWLAASAALLASTESGRSIIALADEAWVESGWVLDRYPMHAGAHFIRGRLHAAIMRQSAFRRFIARTVFGADAVAEASWDLAEHHLRTAAELEPDLPMHHVELATALRDMGRPELMLPELRKALDAAGTSVLDERYRTRARELLEGRGR